MQAKVCTLPNSSRTFRAWLVLGVWAAVVGPALAQATDNISAPADRGKAAGQHQRQQQEQRRTTLRAALQAQREAEAPKPDGTVRQLTPAERAKLREQLRQQRRDAPQDRNGQSQ